MLLLSIKDLLLKLIVYFNLVLHHTSGVKVLLVFHVLFHRFESLLVHTFGLLRIGLVLLLLKTLHHIVVKLFQFDVWQIVKVKLKL